MERNSVIAPAVACALCLVAACDSTGTTASSEVTVTATATVTARVERDEPRPAPATAVLADLMGHEYTGPTLRRLARTICQELRTGERDPAFPWRRMIGYIGEEDAQAFVAHSVAAYCPEQAVPDLWRR